MDRHFANGSGRLSTRSTRRCPTQVDWANPNAWGSHKNRLSSRKRGHAEILRASKIMEDTRAKTAVSSTQENSFMVLAAEALR
jgi:hypothetical protein